MVPPLGTPLKEAPCRARVGLDPILFWRPRGSPYGRATQVLVGAGLGQTDPLFVDRLTNLLGLSWPNTDSVGHVQIGSKLMGPSRARPTSVGLRSN